MKLKFSFFVGAGMFIALFFWISCNNVGKIEEEKNRSLPQIDADLKSLNDQISKDPDNAPIYHQRALYYIESRQYENAMHDVSRSIQLDSLKTDYYITLSSIFLTLGNAGQAQAILEKALKIDPDDDIVLLKMAELQFYRKNHMKSLELADESINSNSNNLDAYFLRAFIHKEIGDTAKAIKNLQMAVNIDQEFYEGYLWLGILHAYQNDTLAKKYYKNALKVSPNNTEAMYDLAMYYQQVEKDFNEAIEMYTQIIEIDPKHKYSHFNLGFLHLTELDIFNVAVKHFTDAIQADPNYAEAYLFRGLSYKSMGDVHKARVDMKKSLEIKPDYNLAIQSLNQLEREDIMIQ